MQNNGFNSKSVGGILEGIGLLSYAKIKLRGIMIWG